MQKRPVVRKRKPADRFLWLHMFYLIYKEIAVSGNYSILIRRRQWTVH